MKKAIVVLVIVGVLAAVALPVAALAQGPGTYAMPCHGGGARGGYGAMHDVMVTEFAVRLGLTPEALNERLANGETMWQVAASQGLSDEQITALMTESRDAALDAAVAQGLLTQEQAEWMTQRQMGPNGCALGQQAGRGQGTRGSGFSRGMGRMMGWGW